MGDGIMALSGAPLAHEDHAVRACYSALRMQESVKEVGRIIERIEGIPIQIRVGVNSGEVVVQVDSQRPKDGLHGGGPNHTFGCSHGADSDAGIDSHDRRHSVVNRRVCTGEVARSGQHKRFDRTGGSLRDYRRGSGAFSAAIAAARGLTRFVGRTAEFETLCQALDRAGASHGQMVALIGKPGVGKSRLFWEFGHSRRTINWLILESSSVSYGKATAYLPVIDLLRGYFSIEDRDDVRKIREKVTGKRDVG